jgi:alkyl hydroperoxide reductase subunit AhpF
VSLIDDSLCAELKKAFETLTHPVRLVVFSQALADPESEQARRLVEEIGALSPKIAVESYNFVLDKDKAEAMGIARIPAIAILGETKDYGIRMYGAPSGYEFGTLIEAIETVSSGQSGLSDATREALAGLTKDVSIQVFSTPT